MATKKYVYFISLSSNVPYVLMEALNKKSHHNEVALFFDLDGAHVLDKRYLKKMDRGGKITLLLQAAIKSKIPVYGCQMNVLIADGLELIESAELAGVVTFLEIAYNADAVLTY